MIESNNDTNSDYQADSASDLETDDGESIRNLLVNQRLSVNHVEDAQNLIKDLAKKSNPSYNASQINIKMKAQLLELKKQLVTYREQCVAQYEKNSKQLEELKSVKEKQYKSGHAKCLYICGAPFFKAPLNFNYSPPNADYLYRKNALGEYFPFDDIRVKITWTLYDKKSIISTCRAQMINYLLLHPKLVDPDNYKKLENETTYNLYNLVRKEDSFNFDWKMISYNALSNCFSDVECRAMWDHYLSPIVNRKPWEMEEENALIQYAVENQYQNWTVISEKMNNGRSPYQCFVHFQTKLAPSAHVKNCKWSPYEDSVLTSAVEKYNIRNFISWNKVAENVPNRNKYQCYERYMHTLKPDLQKEKFSTEEDCIIISFVAEFGEKNFAKIPLDKLPGRSLKQIRGRYNNVLKLVGKSSHWTAEEDQILYDFVLKEGTKSWAELANIFQTHSRVSCRTRYNIIQKYLNKNPNMKIADIPRKKRIQSASVTKDNWLETFIKLKSEPTEAEIIEEPTLKKVYQKDKSLTNYFKNAFNFVYEPKTLSANLSPVGIKYLLTCLQYKQAPSEYQMQYRFTDPQRKLFEMALSKNISVKTVNSINENKNFILPPNWNNIVGYRGILSTLLNEEANNLATDRIASDATYMKFKKRFIMMFYWPALFARIEKAQVISDDDTADLGDESRPKKVYNLFKILMNPSDPSTSISIDIPHSSVVSTETKDQERD